MANPYTKNQPAAETPLLLKVPLYEFTSAAQVEDELEPEEMCVAGIPNTEPIGYEKHYALVYKDKDERVFSLTMIQHHGIVKPGTEESMQEAKRTKTRNSAVPRASKKKKKRKHGRK